MAKPITGKRVLEIVATYLFFAGLGIYTLWPWLVGVRPKDPTRRTLVVYGFSILQEVMGARIFPAFQHYWEQQHHESVQVLGSFSGSGTTTNHILMGAPAQIALLSIEGDARRLKDHGLVRTDWETFPCRGIIARTPIVIAVRRGNPKGIYEFADLAQGPIQIIHPDPSTSGGALWAILAEYGAALKLGETPFGTPDRSAAYLQLQGIWHRISGHASSARGARMQFDSGFGDALVTYEQEAVSNRQTLGSRAEVIVPSATIYTEPLAVIVDRNVLPRDRLLVREFINFLWSDTAQSLFVAAGFRSITREDLNQEQPFFKPINHAFTLADLGGWDVAYETIIQGIWRNQILQEMKP